MLENQHHVVRRRNMNSSWSIAGLLVAALIVVPSRGWAQHQDDDDDCDHQHEKYEHLVKTVKQDEQAARAEIERIEREARSDSELEQRLGVVGDQYRLAGEATRKAWLRAAEKAQSD